MCKLALFGIGIETRMQINRRKPALGTQAQLVEVDVTRCFVHAAFDLVYGLQFRHLRANEPQDNDFARRRTP
jgi:hypothetical protein